MQMMQERAPLVRFETRAIENRAESIKQGRYVADDRVFVIVTPAGSKDEFEQEAQTWLSSIRERARKGTFNPEWARHFEQHFKAWQEGQELPDMGTPIKTWPLLSPAKVEMYIRANVRTVEDLAALTEEGIKNCGMGARMDKQTAANWLETATKGADAGRMSALESENQTLKAQVSELSDTVRQLAERLKEQPKRGRPRKDDVFDTEDEAA
jgi:hypothetical protein